MSFAAFRFESPLRAQHEAFAATESMRRSAATTSRSDSSAIAHVAHVAWIPWGNTAEIVAHFDCVELEYAAIRRGAALCDLPQRGTIEVTGKDRIAFLQRMVTQELRGLSATQVRRTFWLNRKGRIEADLLLCELGERLLIDCSGSVAAATATALNGFIFSEEVAITDVSNRDYRLALHGPETLHLLSLVGASAATLDILQQGAPSGACAADSLAAVPCVLVRHDSCGEVGVEIIVAREHAATLWSALLGVHDLLDAGRRRARPCGWHAYNIARIEAGNPLFEVDFSTSSLPHETSILAQCVSFTKGCYLGQEVVARMASLGKPKQVICAFRMDRPVLPVEGAPIFTAATAATASAEVGIVTSSTLSPMLGAASIGFATVKYAHAKPECALLIAADGNNEPARVQSQLEFVKPSATREAEAR